MDSGPQPKRLKKSVKVGNIPLPPSLEETGTTSSEVKKSSHFERLPKELLWNIFELVPEVLFEMRLTSRLLRARVDTYVLESTTPVVSKFEMSADRMQYAVYFTIVIPERVSSVFELRCKLLQSSANETDKLRRYRSLYGNSLYDFKAFILFNEDNEGWLAFLARCIGKRIESLSLSDGYKPEVLAVIPKLFEGKIIQKLEVRSFVLSDAHVDRLLTSINQHKVEQLSLSMSGEPSTIERPVEVLLELATLVRRMYIYQPAVRRQSSYCFFDVENVDWMKTIIDLFSKRIDTLYIENSHVSEHFNAAKVDRFAEQLSLMGKKVWLRLNLRAYYVGGRSFTLGNLIVQDGCISRCSQSESGSPCAHFKNLDIRHTSRNKENTIFN